MHGASSLILAAVMKVRASAPQPVRRSAASTLGELLAWAVVLVPPFLVMAGKESFRLPKLMAAEWLGLASVLCLAWQLRGSGAGLRDAWRLPAVRAVLPILAIATAGIWTTAHPLQVRDALFDLWIGAACLAGWSAGLERDRQERLLRGLLWPAAVLALIGILQFHRIWEPLQLVGTPWDPRLGITSFAGNPGDFAAFLVLPLLIGLWSLPALRPGPARWMTGLALALCLYALALTQTLASLAAVAVGVVVLLWFHLRQIPRRVALAWLAGAAVLAAVLVLAVAPLRERVLGKLRGLAAGNLNEVLTGRLDGWRAALWMMEEHPATGVGHGAYLPEYVPAKLALLDRGVEFLPGQTQPVFSNAHNEFLEVGADWGIPGLLALAWALWVLFGAARRVPERDRPLVGSGIAALTVLSLAYFPFRVAILAFPAILFLAWVLRPEPEEPEPPPSPRRSRLVWVAVPLLLLALLAQTGRMRDRLIASRMLRQVELLSMAALSRGEMPRGLIPSNLELLRRASLLDRTEVGIPVARGTQYLLLGNGDQAAAAYRQALELEPRPEVHLNLGRALLMAGDREGARRELQLAVRLDPQLAPIVPAELR
jgi:O-antigen ligase